MNNIKDNLPAHIVNFDFPKKEEAPMADIVHIHKR